MFAVRLFGLFLILLAPKYFKMCKQSQYLIGCCHLLFLRHSYRFSQAILEKCSASPKLSTIIGIIYHIPAHFTLLKIDDFHLNDIREAK